MPRHEPPFYQQDGKIKRNADHRRHNDGRPGPIEVKAGRLLSNEDTQRRTRAAKKLGNDGADDAQGAGDAQRAEDERKGIGYPKRQQDFHRGRSI